jgi:uncharacterized membrane protein (GlpM family)
VNKVSLIVGVVGVLASAVAAIFLKDRPPRHYWLLGLASLFPAWLIAFLTVIQPASQSAVDVPLPPRALFSSSAGLIGIIATDYFLRQAQQSGRVFTPLAWWTIGWLALLPAWLIASVGF